MKTEVRPQRASILAAGLGSRLADGRVVPKPLREVAGVSFIVRIIRALEQGPDGTSLLEGRDFVTGPTLLLVSDHLWSRSALSAVASYPIAEGESVLGVDYRIDTWIEVDTPEAHAEAEPLIVELGEDLGAAKSADTPNKRSTSP